MTSVRPPRHSPPWHVAPGPCNTLPIQRAIDRCAESGGGRVVLDPGEHQAGTIRLRSRIELHLAHGARLVGSPDLTAYLRREGPYGARIVGGVATALILAENCHDISLTGEGTIDGNGRHFWMDRPAGTGWIEEKKRWGTWIPGLLLCPRERPRALILLSSCRGVSLRSLTIQNSPAWTLHLLACDHVRIEDIVLRGAVQGCNTDGIDLDACRNVTIENADILTGDDAISLKNTNTWNLKRPSRHIRIRNCRLRSTTHGFTIGTETQDDFEDIAVEKCSIEPAEGHPTLTGIGLSSLDGGALRGIHLSGLAIDGAVSPVQIRLGTVGRGQTVPAAGIIECVTMENFRILRPRGNSLVSGLPGHPLRAIALRHWRTQPPAAPPADLLDPVPALEGEFPENAVWACLPAQTLYLRHIEGLTLQDLTFEVNPRDRRPSCVHDHVGRLSGREAVRVFDCQTNPEGTAVA